MTVRIQRPSLCVTVRTSQSRMTEIRYYCSEKQKKKHDVQYGQHRPKYASIYKCETHKSGHGSERTGPAAADPCWDPPLHATGTHVLQESTFRLKIPASPQEKKKKCRRDILTRGRKAVAAEPEPAAMQRCESRLVPRPHGPAASQ